MIRNMAKVLDLWGAWAASDRCDVDYSPIAAGFKGLLPQTSKTRLQCSDDDGLIIDGCMAKLKKKRPYEHSLLVAHYIYRISKRGIARSKHKDEKIIRVEMQVAEEFVAGCLSMLNLKIDMDF